MAQRKTAPVPVREHRAEAYEAVVNQATSKSLREYRMQTIAELGQELRKAKGPEALLAALRLAAFVYAEWAVRFAVGKTQDRQEIGRIAHAMFLTSQLVLHDRLRFADGFQQQDVLEYVQIGTYFLLVATGRIAEAACVRRQLMKLWQSGAVESLRNDQNDFREFFHLFMRADEAGRWPDDVPAGTIGDFHLLLDATRAGQSTAALDEYCDFRVARALGYASHRATRKNPDPYVDFLIDGTSALVPLEVFALRALHGRAGAESWTPAGTHPLLNPDLLAAFPQELSLESDTLSEQLLALGRAMLGRSWQPMKLIAV